jgi:hypothetical protein
MTVAATGNFGKAAEALKTLIGSSSTFNAEQSNLLLNGDFELGDDGSWTKGGSASIAAGVCSFSGFGAIAQTPAAATVGEIFLVTFTILNYSSGTVTPLIGSGTGTGRTANGTYTENILSATNTQFSLDTADASCDVDDVVMQGQNIYIGEYNPDGGTLTAALAVIQRSTDMSTSIANTQYSNNGELTLYLERAIPTTPTDYTAAGSETDAEQDFYNFVDGVIADCQALSGTAGYLMTRSWTISEIARIDTANRYIAKIIVAWGLATS